jgi:hypothetical protein
MPKQLVSSSRRIRRFCFQPRLETLEPRLAPANVDVLSFHYDALLSGNNANEQNLTLTNLNPTNFGRLFTEPVDGQIYATPLYKHNVTIGGTLHDLAYVVTEHDGVYAFDVPADTDAPTGALLWKRSFIDPANGITSVPSADTSGNIFPEYGITGTPVIDPATNTMYFVTQTKEVRSGVAHYVDKLRAIDITTGQDRPTNAAVTIGDSLADDKMHVTDVMVNGIGDGSQGGVLKFNAYRELQRPALALLNGMVYVGWAGYNDQRPYHGWITGYRASDLSLQKVFTPSPNAGGGGIWESGGGFGTDGTFLYFAVGNSFRVSGGPPAFDPPSGNYGESVLKLDPRASGQTLGVTDYFTPFNWQQLDNGDLDLGSGGTMLLPDSVGNSQHPHLIVETGKTGRLYLIDRDNMGHFNSDHDAVVQELYLTGQQSSGVWGNPAYVQVNATTGLIYYHGSGDVGRAIQVSNATLTYDVNNAVTKTAEAFGYPGGQPNISSNGTANAIMWDLRVDTSPNAVLHAYNANNLSQEPYNSGQTSLRDLPGGGVKYTNPTITDGRVLVPNASSFSVYGLFATHTTVPAAPTNLMGLGISDTQAKLTWNNANPNTATGIKIERSTDGTNFTQIVIVGRNDTTFTDSGLSPGTTYYYRIRATNQIGDSVYTSTVSADTKIVTPVLTVTNVCSCEIDLSWTPSGNDHYKLERAFGSGDFQTIGSNIPINQTTYLDTDPTLLTQRGTYRYRLTAFNRMPDESAVANIVSAANAPVVIDHSTPPDGGFVTHDDLTANTTPAGRSVFVSALARLTDAGQNEAGTVFSNTKVNITNFSTTFTFRFSEGSVPRADGITFIIQGNSPQALGSIGGGLGYGGIRNSLAIKFDLYNNSGDPSEGPPSTGIFTAGRDPTIRQAGLPPDVPDISIDLRRSGVQLDNQRPKKVTLTYNGTVLHEDLLDTVTGDHFAHDYTVDIGRFVGGDTAYVGFGGGTGGLTAIADIQNWIYTPGPEVLPAAPGAVQVTNVGTSTVDIAWTCNSVNETGFIVERGPTAGGPFQQIDRTTRPRYHDAGLATGFYFYRVRAFNDQGASAPSSAALASVGGNSAYINHSAGFASHDDLAANSAPNPPGRPIFVNGLVQLTDGGLSEGGSIWTKTSGTAGRVPITFFDTTFTLRQIPITGAADGLTFAIQNSTNGVNALGGLGGGLGYTGITPSVAVYFDLYNGGNHNPRTGLLLNGSGTPGDARSLAGIINLGSGHRIRVHLTYDGGTLSEVVTDTTTGAAFSTTYTVNIPMVVGGNGLAYVGFTAATGGETAFHDIVDWTGVFANTAPPAYLTVTGFPSPTVAGAAHTFTVTAYRGSGFVNPLYFGTVHFRSSDPQALSGVQLPADYTFTGSDNGSHTFAAYLLTAGTQSITATDTSNGNPTGTQSGIVVVPAATTSLIVNGFPSPITAGTAGTITVTAKDSYGNVATNYTGTVHFTSSDSQAVLPADGKLTNGVGMFSATLKTAGTQSLTATDTSNGSLTATQGGIVVNPAATSVFVVAGYPSPVTAGTSHTFTVTAKDPYGNLTPNYTGTVHVTSSDSRATLPADSTLTNGMGSFSATLDSVGTQSLTATDTANGNITGTQSGIAVVPAGFIVAGFPSPITAGTAGTFTVTAVDANGITTPDYVGMVHFGSSDSQAQLPSDYRFITGDNGTHTFSATLFTAGSQSITATDTSNGNITGTQSGITVKPAAFGAIGVKGFPSPTTAGVAHSFTVAAQDAYGNTVPDYTGTVHITSSDPQADLPDDFTFTPADQGIHFFVATLKTAGTQSLTATDTSAGIAGTQSGIIVTPAGAITLQVAGFPSPTTAGAPGTLTVAAQDNYGNTVTGYIGTVHFTSSDPKAQLPADYTFTASDNGSHTFTATLFTAGTQSITADDAAHFLSGTQTGIVVNPAATSNLLVFGYPSPTVVGDFHDFTVAAFDAYGNSTPNYAGTITFTSDDNLASLPDDYTFSANDMGMQVFSAAFNQVGTYSLTATDTANAGITGTQSGIEVVPSDGPDVLQPDGLAAIATAATGLVSPSTTTNAPASVLSAPGAALSSGEIAPNLANPEANGSSLAATDATPTEVRDQLFADFTNDELTSNLLEQFSAVRPV